MLPLSYTDENNTLTETTLLLNTQPVNNIPTETTLLLNTQPVNMQTDITILSTNNIYNQAPYIFIKCNDYCGYAIKSCYNFYNNWITPKTVAFTLFLIGWIALLTCEIVYVRWAPTQMTCHNPEFENITININYKLHTLDAATWLYFDGILLSIISIIVLFFIYINIKKWKLNYIEGICIFLLTISYIFIFIWTVIGSIIIIGNHNLCEHSINPNNVVKLIVIRIVSLGIFYIISLIIFFIILCKC